MSIITRVRFSHPRGALIPTVETLDASVEVLQDASTDPEHDRYLFLFGDCDTAETERALEQDITVEEFEAMPDYEEQHVFAVTFTEEVQLLAPRVVREGGFSLEAAATGQGWDERWLLPDHESLHTIWEYARSEGFTFDIREINQFDEFESEPALDLTDEQYETLLLAYSEGYFDEPRTTSLEALAETLDISQTAVSGRIRRGVKSLIESTLVEK